MFVIDLGFAGSSEGGRHGWGIGFRFGHRRLVLGGFQSAFRVGCRV